MFGYVKADLSKLNGEERNEYKCVYCSLCNSLKSNYGISARFLLNYDITFLALVHLSFFNCEVSAKEKYCPYKCKKCTVLKDADEVLFYCASVLIILAYEKLQDDIRDEKFIKKVLAYFMSFIYRRKYKRAKRAFPEIALQIGQNMRLQPLYEAENASVDKLAHPSADSLGKIFKYNTDDDTLYRFGYLLGRWIYFMDAADDIEEDKKKKSFNPFLKGYDAERINELLNLTLGEAVDCYKNINLNSYNQIIENVIYDGTFAAQKRVTEGDNKQ